MASSGLQLRLTMRRAMIAIESFGGSPLSQRLNDHRSYSRDGFYN